MCLCICPRLACRSRALECKQRVYLLPLPHLPPLFTSCHSLRPPQAQLWLWLLNATQLEILFYFSTNRKKVVEQMLSHPVRRVLLFSCRSRNLGIHTMAYLSLLDIESHTHTYTHTQSGTPSRLCFGFPGTKASCHKVNGNEGNKDTSPTSLVTFSFSPRNA